MNAFADSYIPDLLTRHRIEVCAGWQRHAIELRVADEMGDSAH